MRMGVGIKVAVRRMTGVTIRWNAKHMTAGVTVVVGAVFQRSVGKRIGMTVGANVLVRAGITAYRNRSNQITDMTGHTVVSDADRCGVGNHTGVVSHIMACKVGVIRCMTTGAWPGATGGVSVQTCS